MTTQPTSDPASSQPLLCPACGYDLRASTGERCSECGLVIDRVDLARSNFPWVYRAQRGRFRAFLSTVWRVTRDSKGLRQEAAKQQSVGDAERFRRVVMAISVTAFVTIAVLVLLTEGVGQFVVDRPSLLTRFQSPGAMNPLADLAVPWSAGMTIVPALAVYSALMGMLVVVAPAAVLWSRREADGQRDAARAIGCYVTAPLAFLGTAAVGVAILAMTAHVYNDSRHRSEFNAAYAVGAPLALTMWVAVIATVFHTGQWRARVTRRGYPTGFLGMGELVLRWAFAAAVCFAVLPWCVGFVWIAVDSFRF